MTATAPLSRLPDPDPAPAPAATPAAPPLVLSQPVPPRDLRAPGPAGEPRRRPWLAGSFALTVLLPVLLGIAYFGAIASDRYAAGAGFAVRGLDTAGGSDVIGAVTGLASTGSTTSDSYIVLKYLESRDMIDRLGQRLDLDAIFAAPGLDPLSRLSPGATPEELRDYWRRRIATAFDATSGIVTFEVQAFSPADAAALAGAVLDEAQALVNALSQSARADTLRFAEAEVARAEDRLRAALDDLRRFRESERSIDPAASAAAQVELLAELDRQLLDLDGRIAAFGSSVSQDAPALTALRRRAEVVAAQIADLRASRPPADARGSSLSGQLARYESLEIEKSFAEQAYASALSSLEQARADAGRQQRYLAVYAHPLIPTDPAYPHRLAAIGVLTAAALGLWGIGVLLVYSVRDHLS